MPRKSIMDKSHDLKNRQKVPELINAMVSNISGGSEPGESG